MIDLLNTPQHLEAMGRAASFVQFCEILSYIAAGKDVNQAKLFSLFVGMSQEVFLPLLLQATKEQENILRRESLSEPIQHHLTLLTHGLLTISDKQNQTFSTLEMQLGSLDLATISAAQIIEQEKAIEVFRETCTKTQFICSKALAIAWNSTRMDLIEKLSSIKEQSQKLSNVSIGHPQLPDSPATGLYATFESRLESVFFDENNKVLGNDEPAIEAMVKFCIWYINDYWEVGLLPHVRSLSELDRDSNVPSEREKIDHLKFLFSEVSKNLERLNLRTLEDLKKNKIYSKIALKDFIMSHRDALV